jgi:hypothetical protein
MKINPKFQVIGLCLIVLMSGACIGLTSGSKLPEREQPVASSMLLADPHQGLDGLKSYHMHAVNEFTGEADGKPLHSLGEYNGDEVRKTQTEFVNLRQPLSNGKIDSFLTGVIGDASYRRIGDESAICHIAWNQQKKVTPEFWPVDMLPAILSGEKTGVEEVNEVKTTRYILDRDSLGIANFENVSGDLWLALDGGYVVKMEFTLSGGEKTFGKGRSGNQKVTYELTKINANDDFIAPAGCLPVLDGIPIMADAIHEYRLPGNLRYSSASSPEKVLEFYKEKLTTQGWQMGSPHESVMKGQVVLFIKKEGDDRLHLSLSPENGTTQVSVFVGKPPENGPTSGSGDQENVPTPTPPALEPAKAGLPEGVPIYPGARNFTGIPGMRLVFTTTDPIEKVMDFYKAGLLKEKWAQLPGTVNVPGVPLMFKKENNMLVIRVTEKDGGSQIEIMMVKQ